MTSFRRLAACTAAATLILVAAGGLVRATGSGLGCLDEWPRCYGSWVAPDHFHGIIEYSHRAIAGVVALLVLALGVVAARRARHDRGLVVASVAAVPLVVLQALLGRVVVTTHLHAAYVTAHLVLAMLLVALTTGVWVRAWAGRPEGATDARSVRMSTAAAIATFTLLVAGALVRERGAGLAFGDWPLFDGSLVPPLGSQAEQLQVLHRVLAALVFGHVAATFFLLRGDVRRPVRVLAWASVLLFTAQVLIGGANVVSRLAPAAVLAHVAVGGAAWAAVVGLAVASRSGAGGAREGSAARGREAVRRSDGGLSDRVRAYVQLTKPRIIVLLLVTTIPAMMLAARSVPPMGLVLATLAGGLLTAGSANAINQFLERDIDTRMARTKGRPLASHRVEPGRALVFGVALGVIGTAWLAVTVNPLAAALSASAILFYVGIYTVLLKRSTPQNIVIGGAAGAAPVLVGWAAVTGSVSPAAWVLFAIIFFWTPPHFWALAVRYREDYAAAGVPMLPVVEGVPETARQILLYSVVCAGVTLVLLPVGGMGLLYAAAALGLGAGLVWLSWRLLAEPTSDSAMRLFRYSISYLALLFLSIAVDSVVA
ncbi:MAG TPA: heme o synthase [Actinomycetota bacterium]|nr:heme o synthase [Actinomycetota bacterium]